MCSDVFGANFSAALLARGIKVLIKSRTLKGTLFLVLQSTLREYGGRDLSSSVTNVAFVHVSFQL